MSSWKKSQIKDEIERHKESHIRLRFETKEPLAFTMFLFHRKFSLCYLQVIQNYFISIIENGNTVAHKTYDEHHKKVDEIL